MSSLDRSRSSGITGSSGGGSGGVNASLFSSSSSVASAGNSVQNSSLNTKSVNNSADRSSSATSKSTKLDHDNSSGRAFALSKEGRILTWTKYTNNHKPLRLDESFGKRKMAIVLPQKVLEYQRTQLREPRRFGDVHVSDSINIRDFVEPRVTFRTRKPETQYNHFNINKYI